mgnify:CR=1 FL=1
MDNQKWQLLFDYGAICLSLQFGKTKLIPPKEAPVYVYNDRHLYEGMVLSGNFPEVPCFLYLTHPVAYAGVLGKEQFVRFPRDIPDWLFLHMHVNLNTYRINVAYSVQHKAGGVLYTDTRFYVVVTWDVPVTLDTLHLFGSVVPLLTGAHYAALIDELSRWTNDLFFVHFILNPKKKTPQLSAISARRPDVTALVEGQRYIIACEGEYPIWVAERIQALEDILKSFGFKPR